MDFYVTVRNKTIHFIISGGKDIYDKRDDERDGLSEISSKINRNLINSLFDR